MKKRYKLIALGAALLIMVGVGAVYALTPTEVLTEVAAAGNMTETFSAQGSLSPPSSVVIAAPAGGRLSASDLKAGRVFLAGEVMFSIDASHDRKTVADRIEVLNLKKRAIEAQSSGSMAELEVRVGQIKGQLDSARRQYDAMFGEGGSAGAAIAIAELSYERALRDYDAAMAISAADGGSYSAFALKDLKDALSIAEKNLAVAKNEGGEQARGHYRDLISSLESQQGALKDSARHIEEGARAALDELDIEIADLTSELDGRAVTAPFDGVILEMTARNGAYLLKNQPVALFYPEGEYIVEAELLSGDALSLKTGDKAACALSDGTPFTAQISFISPVAIERVGAVGIAENRVRVELEPVELPGGVGAGHSVDLTFEVLLKKEVITVPASALVPLDDGNGLYVIRDGRANLIKVETGLRRGGRAEITSGLAEGDTVISDPYDDGVKAGTRVKAKKAA